jgi:hypothetical protein
VSATLEIILSSLSDALDVSCPNPGPEPPHPGIEPTRGLEELNAWTAKMHARRRWLRANRRYRLFLIYERLANGTATDQDGLQAVGILIAMELSGERDGR